MSMWLFQAFQNGVDIEDAAAPGSAAHFLQGGPEARGGGQRGIRRKMRMGRTRIECVVAVFDAAVNEEIHCAFETRAIDDDFDLVTFAHFAEGAAGQGFGSDVADAGAGGDAAETGVGEHRDFLAESEIAERGGDLDRKSTRLN